MKTIVILKFLIKTSTENLFRLSDPKSKVPDWGNTLRLFTKIQYTCHLVCPCNYWPNKKNLISSFHFTVSIYIHWCRRDPMAIPEAAAKYNC